MQNQKGIASVIAIVIIAVVAIGAGTIFYVASQRTVATPDTNLVVTNASIANQNANANGNTNATANVNSSMNANTNTTPIPSNSFSYATVKVGDKIGGMVVKSVKPFNANINSISPNAIVSFTGEVTITGTVKSVFSEFAGANQVCMDGLDQQSLLLMPKAKEDTRTVHVCFSNTADALKKFPLGTDESANVKISDYIISDYPSEVLNTAQFISGGISTAGWKTYTNTKNQYSFKYPNDWQLGDSPTSSTPSQTADDIAFDGVKYTGQRFAVQVSSPTNCTSLKTCAEKNHKVFSTDQNTTGLTTALVGGKAAYSETISRPSSGNWKYYTYYVYSSPKLYIIFTTSKVADDTATKPTFDTILSTFTFDETIGWKTYTNTVYGFTFKYPSDWVLGETPELVASTGGMLTLQSPTTKQQLTEGKIDPGYSNNFEVSFWSNINNTYARGASWDGQRDYTNLQDFFTDTNAPKHKVGETTVAGQKAFEVTIGGAGQSYGVMLEHNGIYELSFATAWDKSKLGSTEKLILSTFTFTQ